MKFIVMFEDNPGTGDTVRAQYMQQHLVFLESNSESILAAGPLREADGTGAGGLWLLDVVDDTSAQQLIESDPFWPTGLRKSVRILAWHQVFSEGQRLDAL